MTREPLRPASRLIPLIMFAPLSAQLIPNGQLQLVVFLNTFHRLHSAQMNFRPSLDCLPPFTVLRWWQRRQSFVPKAVNITAPVTLGFVPPVPMPRSSLRMTP
jgi:hypothetical protein